MELKKHYKNPIMKAPSIDYISRENGKYFSTREIKRALVIELESVNEDGFRYEIVESFNGYSMNYHSDDIELPLYVGYHVMVDLRGFEDFVIKRINIKEGVVSIVFNSEMIFDSNHLKDLKDVKLLQCSKSIENLEELDKRVQLILC